MTVRDLPPEDLPPQSLGYLDTALQKQLELTTRRYFLDTCGESVKSLLEGCEWTIGLAEGLMLEIHCPDARYNWWILNQIQEIATRLARLSPQAKIRVHPPSETSTPFDMRVDERAVYRDS
ncbi:MAG: hypothetical protein AB4050_20730 [Synechococcus sp.]